MSRKVKIRFRLSGNPVASETVWAEQVGDNLYRLLNVPYYAMGYAEGDIVRCTDHDGGEEVVNVERHSGNGTIRIHFSSNPEGPKAQQVLDELVSVGCTFERASSRLVAVSVPANAEVPFSQLCNYLNKIGEDVITGWEIGKNPLSPETVQSP